MQQYTSGGIANFIRLKRLEKAKFLIRTTDMKIPEISHATGFSDYNYFLRIFKKEFGITIMEYVMKKKMQRAEQLLLNSDMSIREVSEACGFPSIEYFSRSFKKHAGLSPYAWRSANVTEIKGKNAQGK